MTFLTVKILQLLLVFHRGSLAAWWWLLIAGRLRDRRSCSSAQVCTTASMVSVATNDVSSRVVSPPKTEYQQAQRHPRQSWRKNNATSATERDSQPPRVLVLCRFARKQMHFGVATNLASMCHSKIADLVTLVHFKFEMYTSLHTATQCVTPSSTSLLRQERDGMFHVSSGLISPCTL